MFYLALRALLGRRPRHYVPVLNLLRYLTFRTGMAMVTAQLVVVAMGSRFIRWMQAKQGKGQPIRAEGIERHVDREGRHADHGRADDPGRHRWSAPCCGPTSPTSTSGSVLLVTAGYGVLGFLDDYAKVTKQTTAGISGRLRLVLEAADRHGRGRC